MYFCTKGRSFLLPFFFARKQLPFSQHRLSGGAQTAHAVHPFRAAPFLHRLTGAHELPQAGSPFPGGEFFAEPQREDSPSADGGDDAVPTAVGKKEGTPAVCP